MLVRCVYFPRVHIQGQSLERHARSRLLRPAAAQRDAMGPGRDRDRDRPRRIPGANEPRAARAARELEATPLSLDPIHLPEYAARTTLRMFAALGAVAALHLDLCDVGREEPARRQAAGADPRHPAVGADPGLLSITVVFFMTLFPGRVLGAECAAIFAIFTSQAWNMAFSFYQSLRTVPAELKRGRRLASTCRRGSASGGWRCRSRMPGLIWNTMMSMSGGWFFVVASEAISVGDTTRAAGHRLVHRAGDRAARPRGDRLGDRRDAGGDPGLRPAAVPPAGRLVGSVPLRAEPGATRRRSVGADGDAPLAAAQPLVTPASTPLVRWTSWALPSRVGARRGRGEPALPSTPRRLRCWLDRAGARRLGAGTLAAFVAADRDAGRDAGRRRRARAAHAAARVGADRAGEPGLGADRRVGRPAAARGARCVQPVAQFLAAFPGQPAVPAGGLRASCTGS